MKKFLLPVVLLFLIGCESEDYTGLNAQRSVLHGSSQVATALFLDNRPLGTINEDIRVVKAMVNEIKSFVETGSVADLTVGELRIRLNNLIPEKYSNFTNAIIAAVSNIKIATDKIGANNVKRIIEVLSGIEYRAEKYDASDHPSINSRSSFGRGIHRR